MIPVIDPKWRTSTVVELCQSMRETGDYSALPILAGALQDADCDDAGMLATMRSGLLPSASCERLVAIVMSADTRYAVEVIERYAAEIGAPRYYGDYSDGDEVTEIEKAAINYESLMAGAREYVEDIERDGYGEYIHMGVNENYKGMRMKDFWEAFQLVTGKTVRDDDASFFSCSC